MPDSFLSRSTSRRQFLRRTTQAAAATLLAGCVTPVTAGRAGASQPIQWAVGAPPPPLNAPLHPALEVPPATLEQKIGQMLMLGFRGRAVGDDDLLVKNIRDQHIGSVVLFRGNVTGPEQLQAFTRDLQSLASIPLLIGIDQEGGKVARLQTAFGFPATPSHAHLGELNNPAETRSQAAIIGQTLNEMGINLNLAPVVDVKVNPFSPIIARLERSFSADPEQVAVHAHAFIDGLHDKGLRGTMKHFPGHGSAMGDTHLGFVDVTATWGEGELLPYRTLIGAGKADAIMTAHIYNAHLDSELPATLSPAIVDGLLRKQLGYDGVVISDDMEMRAISDLFKLEKAFELAILAGIDILAVANTVTYSGTVADRFITTVHRMLDAGIIAEERIDRSYRRIARLKGLRAVTGDS
jgi:beta-N-acetylhexosaminidase